ncbi:Aspartate/glutamate/uridylate kinase [Tribonema minus]|uniref:Aspartokinase n=1 Tax=Tribonema minus TaxID=303371 RepID=A0A835ZI76_9STRA|nr:Aspartate/glutamate/uridylate kinase [Tribonema minus]
MAADGDSVFARPASQKPTLRTVIKFGGSSLATGERLMEVGQLVKMLISQGQRPTMVCSAMGKTTNNLLSAGTFALEEGKVYIDAIRTLHLTTIEELGLGDTARADIEGLLHDLTELLTGVSCLRELTPRTRDHLQSFGERMSVRVMAAVLNKLGVPAQHFDAWTLGLRTTGEFGNADVLDESYPRIKEVMRRFDDNCVAVVTGFIGHSPDGKITTLGRGGSDLTATVIGAAVGADEVQVWKDVDGMMTADPRAVKRAVPVPCVSYEEAAELAYFGAKILHPVAMRPAQRAGIPVRIKNSYNPSHPGTFITGSRVCGEALVTAVTFKEGVELIDVVSTRMLGQVGFLSKVFSIFALNNLSIDMVATSEVSISLTLDQSQRNFDAKSRALRELSEIADVTEKFPVAIISLIANVNRSSEVMAEVFGVMRAESIHVLMLSQGASKVNVGLVVQQDDLDRAVKALHAYFFERDGDVQAALEANGAAACAAAAA